MKRILFVILLGLTINGYSQDSTIVTLSIKARLVQVLAPYVHGSDDTTYLFLFNRWVKAFQVASPPSGTTLVSVDSVSVPLVAQLYNRALNFPQGAPAVASDLSADIATIRAANSYLNRLLTGIDTQYNNSILDLRTYGRKLLRASTQ